LGRGVDKQPVPSLLSLQYPNGRIHEMESSEVLKFGQEFTMYGRRWKVVGPLGRSAGRYAARERRLLCRPHGE
jgi:hypothetical protein